MELIPCEIKIATHSVTRKYKLGVRTKLQTGFEHRICRTDLRDLESGFYHNDE